MLFITAAMAVWLGWRRPWVGAALLGAFGLGVLIESGMKSWLFWPVAGTYPRGHALRIVLLASVLVQLRLPRAVRLLAALLALLVCLSRVYLGEHYWYEVVGGALAGWMLAGAVAVFVLPSATERRTADSLDSRGEPLPA